MTTLEVCADIPIRLARFKRASSIARVNNCQRIGHGVKPLSEGQNGFELNAYVRARRDLEADFWFSQHKNSPVCHTKPESR